VLNRSAMLVVLTCWTAKNLTKNVFWVFIYSREVYVCLCVNCITEWYDWCACQVGDCSSLNVLSLRDNHLGRLPSSIGRLQQLHILDVSENRSHTWRWSYETPLVSMRLQLYSKPLTPTVVMWAQLKSILCQTGLSHHLSFLTSGHSDAQPLRCTIRGDAVTDQLLSLGTLSIHCVPKKTCDYIFYNNFNNRCPITIIFGIVSKSMHHRKMVSFPTSPI